MNKDRVRGQKPYHLRKCGDKVRFPTYNDAWQSSRTIYKHAHEKMCAYRCPLCNDFHIGHQRSEDDLSTAFVPLVKHDPKPEPKQRKVKQPPPIKKQKEVMAYYPPDPKPYVDYEQAMRDTETKRTITKANRQENERLRLLAVAKKEEKARRHEELMRWRPEREPFHWCVAMDDGWNQHL